MIMGSLVVALCLIMLGWTEEIVGMVVKNPEKVWYLLLLLRWGVSRPRSRLTVTGARCDDCPCGAEYLRS